MDLKGRVALVTGAARRVGRAVALRLADAGCHVAVHYGGSADAAQETADACRERGVRSETFQADLADPQATAALPPAVVSKLGQLDILVNNASVFDPMRLDEFTLDAWNHTLQVNVTAPMILAHASREALRDARGRIVNFCDVSTARPWPDHVAYSVSKGALDTLTRVLARAFAPQVNVVGVAPGVAAWPPDYDEQTRERLTRRIPLQRAGSPEDMAATVHFLLAEGDYLTGAILPVDGGRHVV